MLLYQHNFIKSKKWREHIGIKNDFNGNGIHWNVETDVINENLEKGFKRINMKLKRWIDWIVDFINDTNQI